MQQRLASSTLVNLIANDPARAQEFALRCGPLYANFARQRYDRTALDALFDLAKRADLAGAMQQLLGGETVNGTEGRAALHSALRGGVATSAFCAGGACASAVCAAKDARVDRRAGSQ